MKTILVVEDSNMVTKVIRHIIDRETAFEACYAQSLAETKSLCMQRKNNIFAALVDLNLPDAPNGEVVDYMLEQQVPTIVLTGSYDEQQRERLLDKGIVDYVTKEGRYSYCYAVNIVNRLIKNQAIKVLVVDDSNTSRKFTRELLQRNLFQVYEAKDGVEAIKVILQNPDIKLLITDYNMPQMDGSELVKNLRHKYDKLDLIIIGLSAEGKGSLSAKFIKNGANDFLHKPFSQEEFQCRITHNVEFLELVDHIKDAANRDYLTGAYNRRYFFTTGQHHYQQAKTNNTPLAAAAFSIDNFKKINDSYGHEAGDKLLKFVTQFLQKALNHCLLARMDSEVFFALLPGFDNEKARSLIDKVRQIVVDSPLSLGEEKIFISLSAGVTNLLMENIDEQFKLANSYLFRAKEAGQNFVVADSNEEEE